MCIYTLFTTFRESIYTTLLIEGRLGFEHNCHLPILRCTHRLRSLEKGEGRRDVSRQPLDGQTSINQFLFEKSILHDAFHNVVNDAVNDARLVAPIPVPFGIQQE